MYLETEAFWRAGSNRALSGPLAREVERSAIAAQAHDVRAIGRPRRRARPQASPEQVGGTRNWDYRYTWVRDGSFSVAALLGLGFTEEAAAFGDWLRRRVEEQTGDGSGPLKIMYRVDGSSDLVEETLDHLDGYMGSRPVRIGNGASDQLQLDIYGEAMNSIHALDSGRSATGAWATTAGTHIVTMIDWLCEHWHDPDEGIWETRGGRRSFVYGQLMSWVAFDRAIRMANKPGSPRATSPGGRASATAIHAADHDQGLERTSSAPSSSTRAVTSSTRRSCSCR